MAISISFLPLIVFTVLRSPPSLPNDRTSRNPIEKQVLECQKTLSENTGS